MYQLKNQFVLLLLLGITGTVFGQAIKFRNVMGNTGYDIGMSAQQTLDKGYIVCGSTTSVGSGNTDMYVIKTDSLGNPTDETSIGGINVDRGTSIKQTTDSGYVVMGYTNDISGMGGYDILAIKLDAKLDITWKKSYGGHDWDFGNCIEQTNDGGYIICGGTYSYGKGDEDYYLIKTNALGDTLWTRTYGGLFQDEAKSVVETKDGGYILTGFSMSTDTLGDFYTVKTNNVGDTVWTNTFGGAKMDQANDIIELQGGGYAIGGETKSQGAGKSDGIVVELTALGKSGRTFLAGGTEDDNIVSLAEQVGGRIAFVGVTNSYGFTTGKGDIYIVIIDASWFYVNSTTFGTSSKETVNSIASTADTGFIICGTTNGFRNFLDDIYLIKTDGIGNSTPSEKVILTSIDEPSGNNASSFTVYPNPSDGLLTIRLATPLSTPATITVYDLMGRAVQQEIIHSAIQQNIPFQLGTLSNGLYLITITTKNSSFSRPIIVKYE